jgi:predicted helicase
MMSHPYTQAINQYYKAIQELKLLGETKETSTRDAFHDLIKNIIPSHYKVISEKTSRGEDKGNIIYYDLIFGHVGGSPVGFLEDKDSKDHLDKEIQEKRNKGYSFRNILFQDGKKAVLFQTLQGQEASINVNIDDTQNFAPLLESFINYKDPDIVEFVNSYEQFKVAVPHLAGEIHEMIEEQYNSNSLFFREVNTFYRSLQETIGGSVTLSDVKEIIVQHIMTRDLFQTILQSSFNKFNSISKLIETIINSLGRQFDQKIQTQITPYYHALSYSLSKLHNIFYEAEVLKTFYEEFYKAYNPKQADTYGIVYTPIEVVNFMVAMSDSLLQEHFDKSLSFKGVKILDPCTGTGTFIAGLMQYFQKGDLPYKYQKDLHANELSILAYYIGSLYVERLYQNITGDLFKEFNNMCFVDTLDNVYADTIKKELDEGGFEGFGIGEMDEENAKKVAKQNKEELLVIIGNPPYNAHQANENQNNKNRAYEHIDKRIKNTYIKEGSAQNKNMVYDMYVRFIRWASDRIGEEGMVAFITNRSFLDAKGFDGFRKSVKKEFTYIYSMDLGGDIRKGGMGENVFNIMTGVCITFFIKVKEPQKPRGIFYCNPFSTSETRVNKLTLLKELAQSYTKRKEIPWQTISPTAKGQWLNISESNFEALPIELANKANKGVSVSQFQSEGTTLFGLYSSGVKTNRDSWVYDKNKENLEKKVNYFINFYNQELERWEKSPKDISTNDFVKKNIKWASAIYQYLKSNQRLSDFDNQKHIKLSLYRPFTRYFLGFHKFLNERLYQMPNLFPTGAKGENLLICVSQLGVKFECIMSNTIADLNLLTSGAGPTQCLPLYRYDSEGQRHSNINIKMLKNWQNSLTPPPPNITPEEAFYYVYALLHHPVYKEKYKIDLTQNFPRLPLLANDFMALSQLGQKLSYYHLHFEEVTPYENSSVQEYNTKVSPIAKLRSYPHEGKIAIDENTQIVGIPKQAWDYKLGNRSALDWVLEGYKQKKISTDNGDIADTTSPLYTECGYKAYQFGDYKNECIDLLQRMVTVSLETQIIVDQIKNISLD